MNYTAVDLFCGCGGLSRGLENAGFEVLAGFDSWKQAITVYAANNQEHDAIVHDLSDEDGTYELVSGYAPFLIAGGPPCQDFSSAGKREEGDRADLTVKYARLIARVRPKAFIMENVERARISDAYKEAAEIYHEAGYGISLRVLDASRLGVPQKRKRLIMIGVLEANDGFLDARLDSYLSNPTTTVRDYLGSEIDFEHYYRHPRSYERRGIFSVDEPSATIRGVNRPMPSNYAKHAGDAADPDPSRVRALTFRERARIQSFPADYVWPEGLSNAAAEQMIGNAVPVKLAEFVGRELLAYLDESAADHESRFLQAAE